MAWINAGLSITSSSKLVQGTKTSKTYQSGMISPLFRLPCRLQKEFYRPSLTAVQKADLLSPGQNPTIRTERIFPAGPGEIDMKIVPTGKAVAVVGMKTVPAAVEADVLRGAMTTSPMDATPVVMMKTGTEALKQLNVLTITKVQAVPMECIQVQGRQNLLRSPVLTIPRKAMAGSGKL
jgi:hypothetical protein